MTRYIFKKKKEYIIYYLLIRYSIHLEQSEILSENKVSRVNLEIRFKLYPRNTRIAFENLFIANFEQSSFGS